MTNSTLHANMMSAHAGPAQTQRGRGRVGRKSADDTAGGHQVGVVGMTASGALEELIGTAGPRRVDASDAIVLEALDEDRRITDVHRRWPCACAHDDA